MYGLLYCTSYPATRGNNAGTRLSAFPQTAGASGFFLSHSCYILYSFLPLPSFLTVSVRVSALCPLSSQVCSAYQTLLLPDRKSLIHSPPGASPFRSDSLILLGSQSQAEPKVKPSSLDICCGLTAFISLALADLIFSLASPLPDHHLPLLPPKGQLPLQSHPVQSIQSPQENCQGVCASVAYITRSLWILNGP